MSENLKLWDSVCITDPKYTKKANVKGNKITSVAPQYQIKNATEQFGAYGESWGFKSIELGYELLGFNLVTIKAVFFFPNGQFEITNSSQLHTDNACTKVDDNFAKKLETDTLTKALSKLGFNADIFMGSFDDIRYVEAMKEKHKPKPAPVKKAIQVAIDKFSNQDDPMTRERLPLLREWFEKTKPNETDKKVYSGLVKTWEADQAILKKQQQEINDNENSIEGKK